MSDRHIVAVSQGSDGWLAICAECSWRYESTSPSITERAAEFHVDAHVRRISTMDAERLARIKRAIDTDGLASDYARILGVRDLIAEVERLMAERDALAERLRESEAFADRATAMIVAQTERRHRGER